MSILKFPLHFEGSLGEKTGYALFDSGVTFSCLNPVFLERLEIPVRMHRPLEVATAATDKSLTITHAVRLDFYFNDIRLSDEFMVIPDLSEDVIIGAKNPAEMAHQVGF